MISAWAERLGLRALWIAVSTAIVAVVDISRAHGGGNLSSTNTGGGEL
jgi:hypothetical protein